MPLDTSERKIGPRSLKDMAMRVAVRHAGRITDLGGLTFDDAVPILRAIRDPKQLHAVETQSLGLQDSADAMGDVWMRLLGRDVPRALKADWETEYGLSPKASAGMSWYERYTFLKDAEARSISADMDALRAKMMGHKEAKENKTTFIVNSASSRVLSRITPAISSAGAKRRGPGAPTASSTLTFASGSRTKTNTSQNVMKRVRREARDSAKAQQLSLVTAHSLAAPHIAAAARSQIRHAPASMVNDHRVAQRKAAADVATVAPGGMRPPRRITGLPGDARRMLDSASRGIPGTGLGHGNAAHEARLLALKNGSAVPVVVSKPSERIKSSTLKSSTAKSSKDLDDLFGSDNDDDKPQRKRNAPESDDDRRPRKKASQPTSFLSVDDLESGYKEPASRPQGRPGTLARPQVRPSASHPKGPPPRKKVDIFMPVKRR